MKAGELGMSQVINGFMIALSLVDLSVDSYIYQTQKIDFGSMYYEWKAGAPYITIIMIGLFCLLPLVFFGTLRDDVKPLFSSTPYKSYHGYKVLSLAILSALLPFLFIELLPLEKNIVTVLKEHAWDSPQLMQPLNRMWWEHLGLVILNLFMTMLATWQYDAFVVGEQAEKWNKPKAE